MRPVLRSEHIRQSDAWFSVALLLAVPVFYALVLFSAVEKIFPSLSSHFLDYFIIVFTEILVLGYCMARFGRIEFSELLPRRGDYLVLILAVVIVFWIFGLRFGREGLSSGTYDSIRDLPVVQYWGVVFIIVLCGPFLEEAFFRRYFFEILRHHYPISVAGLITIGVATLFHTGISISGFLWAFFYQLVFTIVYVKSRLGVSIIVHAFVNGLILFLSR